MIYEDCRSKRLSSTIDLLFCLDHSSLSNLHATNHPPQNPHPSCPHFLLHHRPPNPHPLVPHSHQSLFFHFKMHPNVVVTNDTIEMSRNQFWIPNNHKDRPIVLPRCL